MSREGRRYRFGSFVFEAGTGDLLNEGQHLDDQGAISEGERLAPQPALVLTMLLESAGSLVTREALCDRIWPDTIVEFDKGLNFCIREVRSALGDHAASPEFIETLPRRGYRFIAPVQILEPDHVTRPGRRTPPRPWRPRLGASLAIVATVAAGLAVALAKGRGEAFDLDPRAVESAEFGGYLLTRAEGDDVARSVEYFRRAIALDPAYARAYAGLGSAYLRLSRIDEAKAALHRSLELDPEQWAPHITLALHALYTDYQPETAAKHFDEALRIAPDEVIVQHTYSWSLAVGGDLAGAIEHMRLALTLNPVSPRVNGDVGRLFYLAGRQDEAVAHCRRTSELESQALRPRDCVVQALVVKGAMEEARLEAAAAARALAASPAIAESIERGSPEEGLDAYWRWAAAQLEISAGQGEDSYVHAAAVWARLRNSDRAFQALEAAYTRRCPVLLQIGADPALVSLRDDPRFLSILERIGKARTGP